MKPFSSAPPISACGNESGEVGRLASANSLCGQLPTRNAGRLTAWPERDFHIRSSAHFATKLKKHLSTCWSPVFFPRHVWFTILQGFGLQDLAPQVAELSFDFEDWWANISRRVSGQGKKGLNSIIILGAWSLWNLRNRCVFYGINPSFPSIVSVINEELLQWSFAGAREFLFSSPKRLQALWCMVLCSWSSQVLFLRVR